ncbi:MAG TPA: FAD-dependent oxidoreductase, partial [Bacillota bacterium]|nr:FAD-dependent oxidoreductase [Bacillota bacterium]
IGFDWASVLKRKNLIVKRLTGGVGMLLKKNGVTVIQGEAKVLENKDVLVDGKTYSAKNLILSTGSSPLFPEIKGLKESYDSGFLKTNRELMDIDRVPETLVIIGGYITNIPIASIFAGFGTQATILENKKTLLPELDEDTRDVLMKSLKKSKINLYTETSVKSMGNQEVIYQNKYGESLSIKADTVLLSMDMKANTECFKELKLKSAGGFISVDKHLETSMKHVYAIGDVNGKMMLAHVASHQALIAVNHILGIDEEIDYDQVPQVVYGFPEIAYVGLSEQEAKKRQIEYKISKFPLQANGRALAAGEREGFIKILAEPKYNQIIGVHIVAENA